MAQYSAFLGSISGDKWFSHYLSCPLPATEKLPDACIWESIFDLKTIKPLLLDGPAQMAATSRAGLICLGGAEETAAEPCTTSASALECPASPSKVTYVTASRVCQSPPG